MSESENNLGFLLADVSRLMRRCFKQRLQGSSLTLAQSRALIYVARNEGVRQVELAEFLELQPMTLARLIDQLAEAELVERRPDPHDRRAYHIFLTAKAQPHLHAIKQVGAEIREMALANMTAGEIDDFFRQLNQVRCQLNTH